MSQLTPDIVADVVAACQAGAEEAAGALSRALDGEFQLETGEATPHDPAAIGETLNGPGLLIKLVLGGEAAVVALPDATGFVPDWCAAPDATGESKLATLAQELGMLLLPESLMAEDFAAWRAEDLAAALTAGGVGDGATHLGLTLVAGDQRGEMSLIWPAPNADALKPAESSTEDAPEEATPDANPYDASEAAPAAPPKRRLVSDFQDLPSYARSLLQIEVPVAVNLAGKRESVERIIDLGPGSILTFDKPCDGPLEIEVAGELVAQGEAVKVGERFGVRVREMVLPGEKFKKVPSPGERRPA